jgi:hypothetical protein
MMVQSAERCDHVVQKRMVRYLVRGDKRLFGVENMSLSFFISKSMITDATFSSFQTAESLGEKKRNKIYPFYQKIFD